MARWNAGKKVISDCTKCQKVQHLIARGLCRACYRAQWHIDNKEHEAEINKRWEKNNKEKRRLRRLTPEYKNQRAVRYQQDKARILKKVSENKKLKRGYYNAQNTKRRLEFKKRVPKWLTKQELQQISDFYINCPKGYSVDHVLPIQGKNVSGLHVLSNLQYLTKSENSRKGNRHGCD